MVGVLEGVLVEVQGALCGVGRSWVGGSEGRVVVGLEGSLGGGWEGVDGRREGGVECGR